MPRGTWSRKDERQYEAIVASCDKPKKVCRRIAAAVVNKRRALEGRTKTVGCHCPAGTRPLKSDRLRCYNPKTHKRVMRVAPKGRKRCSP